MLLGKADYTAPLKGIISQTKAQNIFGSENPIGKIIDINEGMPI